jgi:predicted nucleotide-binding protein (sugar kinase/HSP70/actin superfamily)
VLKKASLDFKELIDSTLPRRPLVGINGEIYLRSNVFSNRNLSRTCEKVGLEVIISPVGEWMKYTSHRNLEDALKDRKLLRIFKSYLRKQIQENDERSIARYFHTVITEKEPSTIDILDKSAEYLSSRCGSEAVLSIGSGIDWLENPEFAGIISVMPHGCMPGGIVAAMSEKFSDLYQKPWISLTYDGFLETNNSTKINEFAELVRFCSRNNTQDQKRKVRTLTRT